MIKLGRMGNPYKKLEASLGYRFRHRSLLDTALTHRSFRFENEDVVKDNQRMEFLGDAALGLVVADCLCKILPDDDEGIMTAYRSQITNGKTLTRLASEIKLGDYIKMGKGEKRTGGATRASNLEDALESIIGAAFLDGGIAAVGKIFKRLFLPVVGNLKDIWHGNPKGRLQEYTQRHWKKSPQYRLVRRDGPAHATVFKVEVTLDSGIKGVGVGHSKQEAEAESAAHALAQLGDAVASRRNKA